MIRETMNVVYTLFSVHAMSRMASTFIGSDTVRLYLVELPEE